MYKYLTPFCRVKFHFMALWANSWGFIDVDKNIFLFISGLKLLKNFRIFSTFVLSYLKFPIKSLSLAFSTCMSLKKIASSSRQSCILLSFAVMYIFFKLSVIFFTDSDCFSYGTKLTSLAYPLRAYLYIESIISILLLLLKIEIKDLKIASHVATLKFSSCFGR